MRYIVTVAGFPKGRIVGTVSAGTIEDAFDLATAMHGDRALVWPESVCEESDVIEAATRNIQANVAQRRQLEGAR